MPETQYPDVDDMFKAQKARVWLRMYGTFSFLPLLLGEKDRLWERGGVVKQNLATALTTSWKEYGKLRTVIPIPGDERSEGDVDIRTGSRRQEDATGGHPRKDR